MTRRKSFILGVCALALLLACNGSSTSYPTRTPAPPHNCSSAENVCEKFVTDRLKAPATAQFSNAECEGPSKDGCYVVTGCVDAHNSFGALIRSDYTCHVCSTGVRDDEHWYHLEDLSIRAW